VTVAELIEALRKMPPALPVGYVNDCADNGRCFVVIDRAEKDKRIVWRAPYGSRYTDCVVLE
jgi:hypothetical protein